MSGLMNISSCEMLARIAVKAYKDMADPENMADPEIRFEARLEDSLTDGRGADKCDLVFCESKTIAAAGNWDIDLVGSVDKTRFGDGLAFARIKGIIVLADADNSGAVRVGGYGAGGFYQWLNANTAYNRVRPGGVLLVWAPDATGYPVTATSEDILRLTNESATGAAVVKVALIGEETDVSSSSSSSSSSSISTSTSSGSSSSSHSASSSSSQGSSPSSSSSSANSSASSSSSS